MVAAALILACWALGWWWDEPGAAVCGMGFGVLLALAYHAGAAWG